MNEKKANYCSSKLDKGCFAKEESDFCSDTQKCEGHACEECKCMHVKSAVKSVKGM